MSVQVRGTTVCLNLLLLFFFLLRHRRRYRHRRTCGTMPNTRRRLANLAMNAKRTESFSRAIYICIDNPRQESTMLHYLQLISNTSDCSCKR